MLQTEALDILKMGKNVFLTGPAGSGKTYVLQAYIDYLKAHAVDVAITASTGIASTHLEGMTIHSWSGIGVRDTLTDYDIDELMERAYLYKRFEKTKVLIIDEVSMLHHFRLDMVEWICRQFKRSEKPFGGMQVILCGDFFQLPPVTRGHTESPEFVYKAESFLRSDFTICHLSEQHRQKDTTYLSILNAIREKKVDVNTYRLLNARMNTDIESGFEPTRLYTHNIDVDVINNRHLSLIDGAEKTYTMFSKGSDTLSATLRKSCLSPENLVLKKGARVMFTKNNPEAGYVNGTTGVVEGFNSFGDPIVVTSKGETFDVSSATWKIEEEGKTKAEIAQLPLRLAWAITVHKSQGMSLDAMEVDLSKSFVKGMGYVALSRVRSLGGVKLLGLNEMALEVDDDVFKKDQEFKDLSVDAVEDLKNLGTAEVARLQKEFMEKIEPEEKKKIKILEKKTHKSTDELTADLLRSETSLKDIAKVRGLKEETIVSHIEKLQEEGDCPDVDYLRKEFKKSELDAILSAFKKTGTKTLSPVYNLLDKQKKKPTYLKVRLARLFLKE